MYAYAIAPDYAIPGGQFRQEHRVKHTRYDLRADPIPLVLYNMTNMPVPPLTKPFRLSLRR
jgi:hypothetical protein